jgi:uncharacterized protein DUF1704
MKSLEETQAYLGVNSSFIDYSRFEGDSTKRKNAKSDFIMGLIYTPNFDYPKLDALLDENDKGKLLRDKKTATYEAVLELNANRDSGLISPEECDLYVDYHENRLKKIMLVESAHAMRRAESSSRQYTARDEFMYLNKEVYGEMNVDIYNGMMTTEKNRVKEFIPSSERTHQIKDDLHRYFESHNYETYEECLLDKETMDKLKDIIVVRYETVLQAIPDSSDDIVYDAEQCRDIFQATLEAGELAELGWKVEISVSKSNPATNVDAKKIYLPADTHRNASQLRRLVLHEQEVHARRGQNGANSGLKPLQKGTADYADVEEGLGVLLECAIEGNFDNPSYHRARDRYITAGLALGIDGSPKDARSTFELLWRMLALREAKDGVIDHEIEYTAKHQAMLHIENAFRGTNFAMPGIIFTKLKVYFEGLKKNADYIKAHQSNINEALDIAMIGKYNHTELRERTNVTTILKTRANA